MKVLINYLLVDFQFVLLKIIYIENITVYVFIECDVFMQIWFLYKEMWLIKQYFFNEYIKLN